MQKEALTLDKIKMDLKNVFRKDIKYTLLAFFISIIPILIIHLLIYIDPPTFILVGLTTILVFHTIEMFVVYFFKFRQILYFISKTNKGEFDVKTDKLLYTEKKSHNSFLKRQVGREASAKLNKPYRLHFSSYKEYQIPKCIHYAWCDNLRIDDKGIFNYSISGDEFYLVIVDAKDIVMAYKTYLFEFQN